MQTDLNQRMGELVEQLPQIGDVASAKVALGGPASGLHLPLMCVFVTILAKIPAYKYIFMYKWN
jgi:hypothetical protein